MASGLVSNGEQTSPLMRLTGNDAQMCAVSDNQPAAWYEGVPFLTGGLCMAVSIPERGRDIPCYPESPAGLPRTTLPLRRKFATT
jgi:hypothetical protein